MYTTLASPIQSYAIQWVQQLLHGLSAPVKIISQINGEENVLYDAKSEDAVVIVVKTANFWLRICKDFDLGFAEAYMLQEIECDNLHKIFDLYITNQAAFNTGNILSRLVPYMARWWRTKNEIGNAKAKISAHYDTSNVLFTNFLSPDLNYSCAHWSADPQESLETAQRRKVHYMIKKARVRAGHHLLEIGCGWGDLLIEAARTTGCQATGLTLSEDQKLIADQRIQAAGLQDRVRVLLCDYRTAPRPERGYDQIISIGMFEHVGQHYLDLYFETISRLLNPDHGVMVVDGITKIQPFYDTTPLMGEYVERYVFPGGFLPTVNHLLESLHRGAKGSLEVSSVINTGPHYGKTLKIWSENFLANWTTIREDFCQRNPGATEVEIEAYRRRWLYYFAYCEEGFRLRIMSNYAICAVRVPQAVIAYETAVEDL